MAASQGRTVTVTLAAKVTGFINGIRSAATSIKTFNNDMIKFAGKNADDINKISNGFIAIGAAAAAGLGVAAKAAIDWESQFTGVKKTVEASTAEINNIEAALRNMARTMPATHQEIAATAEAAGQLGIAVTDIVGFTKTMIQLGETTNLTADQAATSLAQFMNIMGTSSSNVDRLGASLVALGNNGASTEREIMELAARLAGAASQIGVNETATLGFANAMASLGLEAEAGGTAMSQTWQRIDAAVREGGDALDTIARISGTTSKQFKKQWGTDAAGATVDFVEGLGAMRASGQDVNGTLTQLGITGIRQVDTLLRLSGATTNAGAAQNLLRESIKLSGQAYQENTALAAEYANRIHTTEAQTQVALNNLKDAGITIGQAMLPAISTVAGVVADLAGAFASLDPSIAGVIVGFTAAAAGTLVLVGAAGRTITAIHSIIAAFTALGISARTTVAAMGIIGLVLTAAGIAIGAFIGNQQKAKQAVDDYTGAIEQQGQAIGEYTRKVAAKRLEDEGMLKDAERIGVSTSVLTDAILGNADAMQQVQNEIHAYNQEMMKIGPSRKLDIDQAIDFKFEILDEAKAFQEAAASAERQQRAIEGTTTANGQASQSLQQAASEAKRAADAQNQLEEQLRAVINATQELANQQLALSGNQIAYAAAFDKATQAAAANGQQLDITTQAGRDNQTALNSMAETGMRVIATMSEQHAGTERLTEVSQQMTAQFVQVATQMGMNTTVAQGLATSYFAIPPSVATEFFTPGVNLSQEEANKLNMAIRAIPESKWTEVKSAFDRGGVDAAWQAAREIAGKNFVYTVTAQYVARGERAIPMANGQVRAKGGPIFGPGTSTSDSIPAWLSNGEHVLTAREVQALGGHGAVMRLRAAALRGLVPRFNTGGAVVAKNIVETVTHGNTTRFPTVNVSPARLPETMTLLDTDGALLARMQVIAGAMLKQAGRDVTNGRLTSRLGVL